MPERRKVDSTYRALNAVAQILCTHSSCLLYCDHVLPSFCQAHNIMLHHIYDVAWTGDVRCS